MKPIALEIVLESIEKIYKFVFEYIILTFALNCSFPADNGSFFNSSYPTSV